MGLEGRLCVQAGDMDQIAEVLEVEEIRVRSQDQVVIIRLALKVGRCPFRGVFQSVGSDR